MFKRPVMIALFLCLAALAAAGQKLPQPTLKPVEPTPREQGLIAEGIKLHDEHSYAKAIEKYQQVIDENPDCDQALYEQALSYYMAKDLKKALDVSFKLVRYQSVTAQRGYGLIANIFDDQGNPKAAIELYKNAIKMFEGVEDSEPLRSELYYNLGLTHFRQKQLNESREALKKAVPLNFRYPSPNYLLAEVFINGRYRVPALLAASRLISLEYNTQRTQRAVDIFVSLLQTPKKDEKTGNIQIFLDMGAPKDEGDFAGIDLFLPTLLMAKSEKGKSELDNFTDAVNTLIALLAENQKVSTTFVGKTYLPFMVEMKRRNFVKPFASIILKIHGSDEAAQWITANGQQVKDFADWSRRYSSV